MAVVLGAFFDGRERLTLKTCDIITQWLTDSLPLVNMLLLSKMVWTRNFPELHSNWPICRIDTVLTTIPKPKPSRFTFFHIVFCYTLNKWDPQSDFASKSLPIWFTLYGIERLLLNSIYINNEVGTNYTHCVHRLRWRPVTPEGRVDDLSSILTAFKEMNPWVLFGVNQRCLTKVFIFCWNLPPQRLQHALE